MKISHTLVCTLLASALCASTAFAQNRQGQNGGQGQGQGQQGGGQGGFGQGGQVGGPGGGQGGGQQGGPGGGGQGGPGGGRGGFGGGFGMMGGITDPTNDMIRTLPDLTDDQKNNLHSTVQSSQQALTDLRTAEAAKMQELWQSGDQQAIQDEMASAQKDTAELQTKANADLDAILTPAQKATWQGHLLAKLIKTRLISASLTKEQVDKIEDLAKAAGKDITAAKDTDAKSKIYGSIFRKVVDSVITDEQAGKVVTATIAR